MAPTIKADDMKTVARWSREIEDKGRKDWDGSKAAINKYLDSTSISAEETALYIDAKALCKRSWFSPEEDWDKEYEYCLECDEGHFWEQVDDVLGTIPHTGEKMDKLVALFDALVRLPPRPHNSLPGTVDCRKAWVDLPGFPYFVLENHAYDWWEGPLEETHYEKPASLQHLLSNNTFIARMFENHPHVITLTAYPIGLLIATLEEEITNKKMLALRVRIAAIWICNAREWYISKIPDNTNQLRKVEFLRRVSANGPLYHGKSGISQERWNFWKQRFLDLSKELEGEAKQAALDTAAEM